MTPKKQGSWRRQVPEKTGFSPMVLGCHDPFVSGRNSTPIPGPREVRRGNSSWLFDSPSSPAAGFLGFALRTRSTPLNGATYWGSGPGYLELTWPNMQVPPQKNKYYWNRHVYIYICTCIVIFYYVQVPLFGLCSGLLPPPDTSKGS